MRLALCWNSRLASGDVFGFATAGKPDCYKIQLVVKNLLVTSAQTPQSPGSRRLDACP